MAVKKSKTKPGELSAKASQKKPQKPVLKATAQWQKFINNHKILFGAVLCIVLAAFIYGLSSYLAYRHVTQTLGSFKTAKFSGSIEFYGQDFLSAYDSKMSFSGSAQRQGYSLNAVNTIFNGNWAKLPYTGQADLKAGRLYFKVAGPNLPVLRYRQSPLFLPLQPDWYAIDQGAGILKYACENQTTPKAARPLELYKFIKTSGLKSVVVMPFSNLDGRAANYFAGEVDNSHFPAIFDDLKSLLPDGCDLNTFGLTATDVATMRLHFELWNQAAGDTLRLTLEDKALGSRLMLNIKLTDYNSPALVALPNKYYDLDMIAGELEKQYQNWRPLQAGL